MSKPILTFFQCAMAALVLVGYVGPAGATPLEPAACEVLKIEHDSLTAAGVEADMAHGPEWAKANLATDRLKQIERLIELNEQLSFRCGEITMTARPAIREAPKPSQATAAGKDSDADDTETASPAAASAQPQQADDKPVATKKKKSAANKAKSKDKDTAAAPADPASGGAQKP